MFLMKINKFFIFGAVLFSLWTGRADECNIGSISFKFDRYQDEYFKEIHQGSSSWGLCSSLDLLNILLKELMTKDDTTFFRCRLAMLFSPYVRRCLSDGDPERWDTVEVDFLSNVLAKSNLDRIEKELGKEERERLEEWVKRYTMKSVQDKDDMFSIVLEEECPEEAYKPPLVYAMKVANDYVTSYLKDPSPFHLGKIDKEFADLYAVVIRERVAIHLLIRNLVYSNLFTKEEGQVIFDSLKKADREELDFFLKKFGGYWCPSSWEETIGKMSYEELIDALIGKLDFFFPERNMGLK